MVVSGFLSLVRPSSQPYDEATPDEVAFYIPQFGVVEAYTTAGELDSALAIYLTAWAIVTLIFFIVCPLYLN
jgi:hypothetical protein